MGFITFAVLSNFLRVALKMTVNLAMFCVKSESGEKSWKRGNIWIKC